jgi:nitrite reductase/ring-hydroxylating ferredoxin subunit
MSKLEVIKNKLFIVFGVIVLIIIPISCSIFTGISHDYSITSNQYKVEGNSIRIDLGNVITKFPKGKSIKIEIDDPEVGYYKIIIIRTEIDNYLAFENKCPHNGKELNFKNGILKSVDWSLSEYNIEGKRINGPIQEDLKSFQTEKSGDILTIFLK